MAIHGWWASFGSEVSSVGELAPVLAKELASLAKAGALPNVSLVGMRLQQRELPEKSYAAVYLEIDVERPQDLAYSIKAVEPVAIVFPADGEQPSVLSLREDFPDTMHQNWSPPGGPCCLCIDDRPWPEARLTITANDIIRRIQLWLAKAARGELHDPAQPPDPLFYISPLGLVLPTGALADSKDPIELAGYIRPDNQRLIIARPTSAGDTQPSAFTVLTFQAAPRAMARFRFAPNTVTSLASELEHCGINLMNELKTRLKAWAGLGHDDVRRLSSRLVIVVAFPTTEGVRHGVSDFRAFLTVNTAGEIGVALGVLYANKSQVGDSRAYLPALCEVAPSEQDLPLELAQVYFTLDRDLAATIAGRTCADKRPAVLVGAGSLGSQLSVDLAREGSFQWTVVDNDHLLPHNFARHALFPHDVGAPKARALANKLAGLLDEPVTAISCNVLTPTEDLRQQLTDALTQADVIIDASTSVAVSRYLSDMTGASARKVCTFFNPSGTSVVVLAENADRTQTLRDLEAQYHRLVLTEPSLASHLAMTDSGVRYTGSCRSLTNRIPAVNAAILSALSARGIGTALATDEATIAIWTLSREGEVRLVRRSGSPVTRMDLGAWSVSYDTGLLDQLTSMRRSKLPNETGGVLLGIVDVSRKSVHIVQGLPQPDDSRASKLGFERGVEGLAQQVRSAVEATLHQVRYVGEWHSHPDKVSAMPSRVDFAQVLWLGEELRNEGLPALMAIAGQDGRFTIVFGPMRQGEDAEEQDGN